MNSSEFIGYLKFPNRLNNVSLTELQNLLDDYPYCSSLRLLLAKNLFVLNSEKKDDFIKLSSVYLNDRKKLFKFIHDIPDYNDIQPRIPSYSIEEQENNNNLSLETYANANNSNDLIDNFLREQPKLNIQPSGNNFEEEETSEEVEKEQEFVSEILAEIYWKQGSRDKAIHIYEKLSLNFPEKSSYFATQIEKIKKEII
ncbi:MAG: hypothetical protein ABR968_04365 [Bacteroidales bacterium]